MSWVGIFHYCKRIEILGAVYRGGLPLSVAATRCGDTSTADDAAYEGAASRPHFKAPDSYSQDLSMASL
jgi:hypothetical protein